MNWQPISTAPKDGSALWLVQDGAPSGLAMPEQFSGFWQADVRYREGGYWRRVGFSIFAAHPTHWMPLPEPPA